MNLPESQKLEHIAYVLKTIAHPVRLKVVCLLGSHERLSVSDICRLVDCEQSLVSHHLNLLKLKGVLGSVREGKNIFYFLVMPEILGVLDCVGSCNGSTP